MENDEQKKSGRKRKFIAWSIFIGLILGTIAGLVVGAIVGATVIILAGLAGAGLMIGIIVGVMSANKKD